MGWGIWKKIKQGVSKVIDFGKKLVKKGVAIADKVMPVLEKGGVDVSKAKDLIDKARPAVKTAVIPHGDLGVKYSGRTWKPQFKVL